MNNIENRILAFSKLGDFIRQFTDDNSVKSKEVDYNDLFFDRFQHQIKIASENNQWFTKENIYFALQLWAKQLTKNKLSRFVANYKINDSNKTIAIIMAGNIPLVGFHDFLVTVLSGNKALIKQSSNDKHLLPFLTKYLEYVEPCLQGNIRFTEEKLKNYDAVIATGSNNTARYFNYYFKDKPNIIRKNRNSVAVLKGDETFADFEFLAEDIFRYFGLGCRSVSKLFVPLDYNFDTFFNGMYTKKEMIYNQKYANNYDYNKAVYLMSEFDILDNGFLTLKEDTSYSSPIASVFYEYYENEVDLKIKLHEDRNQIQCIVAKNFIETEVPFGKTQEPKLSDFADGIDTLEFLVNL